MAATSDGFVVPLRTGRLRGSLAVVFILGVSASCSPQKPTAAAVQTAVSPVPAPAPQAALWGDLKPLVSVKELMRDMIDPASDLVFDSIGTIIVNRQRREIEPKTDEDWQRIRTGAVTMAEGVYLLKMKRPFAPAGDDNNSTGPEPAELSPAQITAKIEKDPVLWNAKIEALRNVGLEIIDVVNRKDKDGLWEASDNLDQACENCHLQFWYPNEGALLKKLDQKLDALYGVRADRSRRLNMGMGPEEKKP